jgi:hypothetical protein
LALHVRSTANSDTHIAEKRTIKGDPDLGKYFLQEIENPVFHTRSFLFRNTSFPVLLEYIFTLFYQNKSEYVQVPESSLR